MSAFVVEDLTINRVVTMLKRSERYFDSTWFLRKLKDAGYDLLDGGDERLGRAMFDLNCKAVDERYRPGACAEFRPLDYRYSPALVDSKVQGIKALDCWLYQCSEGGVPEDPLYKLMDEMGDGMRRCVVSRMDIYEKADSWK
jgi:hypothetical protein